MTSVVSVASVKTTSTLGYRRRRWRRKKMSGKNRFRALVRTVISNRNWLELVNLATDDLGDNVKANVRIIQSKATRGELRLGMEKVILRKDPQLRTDEEKHQLFRILGDLKCFRRYPEEVRKELVAHTYFVYYGPNRTLIRQGHEPTYMAVLLTGEVAVYHTFTDPVFNKLVTERKANMLPGTMIGEASLINNTSRIATVVTATPVELLVLNKVDFEHVLKDTLQAQWNETINSLKKFPYFATWNEMTVRDCCIISDIKLYRENDIILGLDNERNTLSHFILYGKCTIVHKMLIEKDGDCWRLCKNQKVKLLFKNQHFVCMQTCVLSEGACFGIGENLSMKSVIADSDMAVLRIPFFHLEKNNAANIWTRIKTFMDSRIPSTEEIFKKFLEDRKWKKYRKSVCENYKVNKSQNHTTFHDIPLTLRTKLLYFDEQSGHVEKEVPLRKTIFPDKRKLSSLGIIGYVFHTQEKL